MSDKINDGGPAFPAVMTDRGWIEQRGGINVVVQPHDGMSLRDYFAGQAMAGITARADEVTYKETSGETVDEWRKRMWRLDAQYAYNLADAMLAARKEAPRE